MEANLIRVCGQCGIIIRIHFDDCLIIGKDESIDCLIDKLKKHEFNLKVERNVNVREPLHTKIEGYYF
jgi:hypothetical protein